MIYAKFINEDCIKRFRNPIKVDDMAYSNPTVETLKTLVYLPVNGVEKPENKEGYYIVSKYRIDGDKILQEWNEVKNEVET